MQLKIKLLKWSAGRPVAIIHKKLAERLNLNIEDRILILNPKNHKKIIAPIDIASRLLKKKEIAITNEISKILHIKKGIVDIAQTSKPRSVAFIQKKLNGKKLNKNEIYEIIKDIVSNALTESEIAYFVSGVYERGMTFKEEVNLTKAIVDTGKTLKFKGKTADKHSIGGIPGNRTTPIIVSICAQAGLKIPKTSSRAITTPAGTADVVETVTNVSLSISELKKVVRKTNACLIWGGALTLAPADDKLIRVERLLNLDPQSQLLASIMSKKLAVGSKNIIIDIPYGKTAKVSKSEARKLERRFKKLAKYFKINLKCILTKGNQPIGNGIGPALELLDVLAILKQEKNRPLDLESKSVFLAGQLLEITKKAEKGKGEKKARKILESGLALKKFKQIIKAQGGRLSKLNLKSFKFKKHIIAEKACKIKSIDNKKITMLAKIAGCPIDKYSGLYLWKHVGEKVKKNEKILTIYSESKNKLKDAVKFYKSNNPITTKNLY